MTFDPYSLRKALISACLSGICLVNTSFKFCRINKEINVIVKLYKDEPPPQKNGLLCTPTQLYSLLRQKKYKIKRKK